MIRVVLAVALSAALLGASLPAAERAERDRNAAVATDELEELARTADRLAAENDPVVPAATPATATVIVAPPVPTVTDGGRIVVDDDRLAWVPATGEARSVDTAARLRTPAPLVVADRTRLRLALVRTDDGPTVRVRRARRARVEEGSRGQTARVGESALVRGGLPV